MSLNESTGYRLSAIPAVTLGPASSSRNRKTHPSELCIPIANLDDIVPARRCGREMATQLGFSHCDLTLIATAISEIARNAVEYANGGDVVITPISSGNRKGLKIVVTDHGPGIADIANVMRDGYSTANRLGIGLPGTRRLMDEFEIISEIGSGTTVTMKKWAA
jgi:serine/threonine-protein kinase RsbT